jgi:hypothetical protein
MTAWRTTSRKDFLNETDMHRHSTSIAQLPTSPTAKETKACSSDKNGRKCVATNHARRR